MVGRRSGAANITGPPMQATKWGPSDAELDASNSNNTSIYNPKSHPCNNPRTPKRLTPGLHYKIPVFSDPDPGKS